MAVEQTDLVIAVDSSQVKSATEALKALGFQATTAEVASDKLAKAVADTGKAAQNAGQVGATGIKKLSAEVKQAAADAKKLSETNLGNQVIRVDSAQIKQAANELKALGFQAVTVDLKLGGLGTIREELEAIKEVRSTLSDLNAITFEANTGQISSAAVSLRNLGTQAIMATGDVSTLSAAIHEATGAMAGLANAPAAKAPRFDDIGWAKFREANIKAAREQQHAIGLSGLDATTAALKSLAKDWESVGASAAAAQQIAQSSIQATNAAIHSQSALLKASPSASAPLQLGVSTPQVIQHQIQSSKVADGVPNAQELMALRAAKTAKYWTDQGLQVPAKDTTSNAHKWSDSQTSWLNMDSGRYGVRPDASLDDVVDHFEGFLKANRQQIDRKSLFDTPRLADIRDKFYKGEFDPDHTLGLLQDSFLQGQIPDASGKKVNSRLLSRMRKANDHELWSPELSELETKRKERSQKKSLDELQKELPGLANLITQDPNEFFGIKGDETFKQLLDLHEQNFVDSDDARKFTQRINRTKALRGEEFKILRDQYKFGEIDAASVMEDLGIHTDNGLLLTPGKSKLTPHPNSPTEAQMKAASVESLRSTFKVIKSEEGSASNTLRKAANESDISDVESRPIIDLAAHRKNKQQSTVNEFGDGPDGVYEELSSAVDNGEILKKARKKKSTVVAAADNVASLDDARFDRASKDVPKSWKDFRNAFFGEARKEVLRQGSTEKSATRDALRSLKTEFHIPPDDDDSDGIPVDAIRHGGKRIFDSAPNKVSSIVTAASKADVGLEKVASSLSRVATEANQASTATNKSVRLRQSEREVLGLLVHDKAHITNRGEPEKDLDSAIKKLKTKTTTELYRGVSDEELADIRAGKANHYLSFSEDRKIAERFGKNIITLQPGVEGLNYGKWAEKDTLAFKRKDPKYWESQDGQHMLDTFREEKEWILPHSTKLIEQPGLTNTFKATEASAGLEKVANSLSRVSTEANEAANASAKLSSFLRDPAKAVAPAPQVAALFKPPVQAASEAVQIKPDFNPLRDLPKAVAPAPQVAALFKIPAAEVERLNHTLEYVDDAGNSLLTVSTRMAQLASNTAETTREVSSLRNRLDGVGGSGGGKPPSRPPTGGGGSGDGGNGGDDDEESRRNSDLNEINSFLSAAERAEQAAARMAKSINVSAKSATQSLSDLSKATTSLGATDYIHVDKLTSSLGAMAAGAREAASEVSHLDNIRVRRLDRLGTSFGAQVGPTVIPPKDLRGQFAAADISEAANAQALLQRLTAGTTKEFGAQAKALDKSTHAHNNNYKSARRTTYEAHQLSYQLHDFTVQVLGGQSPLLAFVQQGSQLAGTFGGIGGAFRAVTALITPMVAGIIAAGTAVVGFGLAMAKVESSSRSLNTLKTLFEATGRGGEVSEKSLKGLIQTLQLIPDVSKDAAIAIVTEFGKASEISTDLSSRVALLVADFARGTGQDIPAAAKQLAQAFEDPVKGVKALEEALHTLSSTELLSVRDAANTGDKLKAQELLYAATKRAVEGLAKANRTELEQSINSLSVAWKKAMQAMDQSTGLKVALSILASMVDQVTKLVNLMPELEKKFSGGLNGVALDAYRTVFSSKPNNPTVGGKLDEPIDNRPSALRNLPEPQVGMTSSFQGPPEKVLAQISSMKDKQERSNAFAAYQNQLAGTGATTSASGALKSPVSKSDEEIKRALALGESYRGLSLRIETLTKQRDVLTKGHEAAIETYGAESLQARELAGSIEGISKEIVDLNKQKNADAERIADIALKDRINAIKDALSIERDGLTTENQLLQTAYQLGEVSLKDFLDKKVQLLRQGTADQIKALDDQIAEVQKRLTDPNIDGPRKEQFEDQLKDLNREKSLVSARDTNDVKQANDQLRVSYEQLQEQVESYRMELLRLQGDETSAAKIQTDQAIRRAKILSGQAAASGLPAVNVSGLQNALDQQNALNRAKEITGYINEGLALQESAIERAAKTGAISELTALQQIGAARQKSVSELEKIVEGMEAVAALTQNKDNWRLQLDTAQARDALEKLKVEMDPLKEKFDNMFKDGASSAIADFLNGTKTAKEALKDFGKSITTTINNMVAKELSNELFGKEGMFGGAGGFFAKLFGGNKPGTAAAKSAIDTSGVTQSLSSLQTTGIDPATEALTRLAAAANSAASAMGGGGGTGNNVIGTDPEGITKTPVSYGNASGNFLGEGVGSSNTGEQSVFNMFSEADKASAESAKTTKTFDKVTASAVNSVANLAEAASRGGSALSLIPSIISAIAAVSGTSGGGAGLVGSILGSIFKIPAGSAGGFSTGGGGFGTGADFGNQDYGTFFHKGGVVGKDGETRFSTLKSDELVATLQKGEEVLTKDDPRHRDNLVSELLRNLPVSGARELGGRVSPNRLYRINERNPEILQMSGQQYLMMGNRPGNVLPNNGNRDPAGIMQLHQNFYVHGQTSRASQEQISGAAYRGTQRAMTRTY